ncbi:hypothetical protein ALI144C_37285 [Actinosynnema sp. ALI-1.44]|uniref:hypothetical protein n=1 Tax=Actinosynnema sp. ALI-1.44 TaxID=1933779 RepID=UPI00097C71B3|nr:hypothetical protein [Actinosynnema sp. ALI-1.44]ONI76314.1 hypothetical protein ALI144C_37285 [Actinosynnema sp. ALI-1.44]
MLRIAEREVARFRGRQAKRNQRETSWEVAAVDVAEPGAADVDRTWMAGSWTPPSPRACSARPMAT